MCKASIFSRTSHSRMSCVMNSGALVGANTAWHASRGEQLRKSVDHLRTRETAVHLLNLALPCTRPRSETISADCRSSSGQTRSPMPTHSPDAGRSRCCWPHTPFSPLLRRCLHLVPTSQAIHPSVARLPALGAKKPTNPAVTKPGTLLRQLLHGGLLSRRAY